jgi:hypothetical protein
MATRKSPRRDPDRQKRIDEWVQRNLENAPPLNTEQRELIRRLLKPDRSGAA